MAAGKKRCGATCQQLWRIFLLTSHAASLTKDDRRSPNLSDIFQRNKNIIFVLYSIARKWQFRYTGRVNVEGDASEGPGQQEEERRGPQEVPGGGRTPLHACKFVLFRRVNFLNERATSSTLSAVSQKL